MKTAIYPGSFNPWHKGHQNILEKALKIFDQITIVSMQNPEKNEIIDYDFILSGLPEHENGKIKRIVTSDSTLKKVVSKIKPNAIIRGLRNGHDLQYEMNQQYWNEDVGIEVPFVYFITDRSLSHVSSSGIRVANKLGLEHGY